MRFTDAHSAATVCTPTRYSLMTGRMCFRTGHQSVFTGAGGPCLILPVLLGEQGGAPLRPYLIQQTMRHMLSIRVGDWKYIDHAGSGGNDYDSTDALWSMKPYALPNTDPGAAGQLYDLAADPGETANLFSRRPDVVARLKALLDESVRKGRSAPPRSAAAREVRLRNKASAAGSPAACHRSPREPEKTGREDRVWLRKQSDWLEDKCLFRVQVIMLGSINVIDHLHGESQMNLTGRAVSCAVLCSSLWGGSGLVGWLAAAEPTVPEHRLGVPPWASKRMEYEPILFVQEKGKTVASGTLLFTPTAAPRLTHPDRVTAFVEGQDFTWQPGSRTIELIVGSRIPFKTAAEMTPPAGSPHTLAGGLWHEGHFFHDLQMLATYDHAETWDDPAAPERVSLTRTLVKLRAKQPLTLVALGDSITEGYNASGLAASAPPFQPAYPQLVADTLAERFGAPVTLVNLAKAGTGAAWGLSMVEKLAAAKPDLVILAFGMNHGEPAPAFEATMRKLLEAVVQGCPDADVILVAPMTCTPRMRPAQHFLGYLDALRQLETPTVAMADVTTPWLKLLERKPFADLSGNNVNHPNDFGHRVYAHVVCALFEAGNK